MGHWSLDSVPLCIDLSQNEQGTIKRLLDVNQAAVANSSSNAPEQDWFAKNAPTVPPQSPDGKKQGVHTSVSQQTQVDDFAAIVKPITTQAQPSQQIKAAPAAASGWTISDSPTPPTAQDSTGGLSLQELSSSNPNNEGLYYMKDTDGRPYAIPYSNVEAVGENWRTSFVNEEEAERYEKDKRAKHQRASR